MRNSRIILCQGINVDRDYVNVLSYSESEMLELCETNAIASSNTYSFLDMSKGIIYSGFDYNTCLQANYIAFQNSDYSNKWFFAFVDDVIYKGDKNTEIRFTVDSWSTWFDYWTTKTCFVSREHVDDDTIGKHTVPEDIDVGEVICDNINRSQDMSNNGYLGVFTNYIPGAMNSWAYEPGQKINRIITGSVLVLFDISSSTDMLYFELFLRRANKDNKIDDIKNICFIPYTVIPATDIYTGQFEWDDGQTTPLTATYKRILNSNTAWTESISFSKPLTFTGFTPKNNKLFVYPTNYLVISNNNGEENILKIENFSGANCTFTNEFAITIGGSGRMYPTNYRGLSKDIDSGVTLGKLPTFEWSSDAFTNWLTQNAVNNQINLLETAISASKNAIQGNILGAAETIANKALHSYGSFYEAKLLPNKVAGSNTGDVSFSNAETNYMIRRFRPKDEYLQIIDDYFTRFGYKINRVKLPNITGRLNFNYVEIGQNDEIGQGNIPFKYMEEINQAARKGVTIWHNHENIGNFSVTNTIVTPS